MLTFPCSFIPCYKLINHNCIVHRYFKNISSDVCSKSVSVHMHSHRLFYLVYRISCFNTGFNVSICGLGLTNFFNIKNIGFILLLDWNFRRSHLSGNNYPLFVTVMLVQIMFQYTCTC